MLCPNFQPRAHARVLNLTIDNPIPCYGPLFDLAREKGAIALTWPWAERSTSTIQALTHAAAKQAPLHCWPRARRVLVRVMSKADSERSASHSTQV